MLKRGGPPRIPVAEQLKRYRREGDCWIWTGSPARKGYGAISMGRGKTKTAHRASYEHFVGPIPAGALICHRCNTPLCINPAHLYAGSPHDNARDRKLSGGYPVGPRC